MKEGNYPHRRGEGTDLNDLNKERVVTVLARRTLATALKYLGEGGKATRGVLYLCISSCLSVYLQVYTPTNKMYACICVYFMYVCMYVCICVCMQTQIRVPFCSQEYDGIVGSVFKETRKASVSVMSAV